MLVAADPGWPAAYEEQARVVRAALGDRVALLEHVGSTAVPGLAAKPVLDLLLVVTDSADEDAYLPELEETGLRLRIREPGWFEHRMLARDVPRVNLHVFTAGCPEVERMLLFRDRLRSVPAERELYERTKRELAAREWRSLQEYADAKSEVVEAVIARARS